MRKPPLYGLYVSLPRSVDVPEGGMEYGHLLTLHHHLLGSPPCPARRSAQDYAACTLMCFLGPCKGQLCCPKPAVQEVISLICCLKSSPYHGGLAPGNFRFLIHTCIQGHSIQAGAPQAHVEQGFTTCLTGAHTGIECATLHQGGAESTHS